MKYGGVNFTNIKEDLYSYPFNRGPPQYLVYRISAWEKKTIVMLVTSRTRQMMFFREWSELTVHIGNTELP